MFNLILLALSFFIALSEQQHDPLKDFCRLFGHQTTIVDRKLYINGGQVNWSPVSPNPLNYSSTWTKAADFDVPHLGFPEQTILTKNETVPSVSGGVLWSDTVNKIVYLYGGEYNDEKPDDFKMWFYDIVYNTWNASNATTTNIQRASWGAGVSVQDKAQGYYFGGWLTDKSVPGYAAKTPLKNLLIYDMLQGTFKNQSGPADNNPRAEGVMVYLPVGDTGMLVYFGGLEFPYSNSTARAANMTVYFPTYPDPVDLLTRYQDIHIYDIANNKWYMQKASGNVPESRRRFCAGATWSDDRSSYNMFVLLYTSKASTDDMSSYLYGGASVGDGVGFTDVYILSLPSFTWIRYYPDDDDPPTAGSPHHSLTCDVYERSQMIVMGGAFTNTSDCDIPGNYGQHGLDLGRANSDKGQWAMFNKSLTTYQVPPDITKTIGGGPTGGATRTEPTSGWGDGALATQFKRPYTPTPGARQPTRPIPTPTKSPRTTKGSNKGAIIGGAVGGAIGGLLLVAAVGFCLVVYRRRRTQGNTEASRPVSELPSQPMAASKSPGVSTYNTPSTNQYSPQPSEGGWSYPTHGYAGQTVYAPSVAHSRNTSDKTYTHPYQTSPVEAYAAGSHSPTSPTMVAHELPIIHSPVGFSPTQLKMPSMMSPSIDPYFAQHPPRENPGSPKS